jgi:glycosyltransferase involved in cell wall biosynthesis
VIVVSDGSMDESNAPSLPSNGYVSVIRYVPRQGKGVALRVGMQFARGQYVAFIDADGDLDVSELNRFLSLMDIYQPDLVVGSKRHPLSSVQYPLIRRAMSRVYQTLLRAMFRLNVRDTQTGMKLIRREVLDAVLPRLVQRRFAFDLEFLVVARRLGYSRIMEAPVSIDYKFRSTVNPRAVVRILGDTAAIFYRLYVLRLYDPSPEAAASAEGLVMFPGPQPSVDTSPLPEEAGGA